MSQGQEAGLCAWLEDRFCRSTVEIRAHICAEFGLDYCNRPVGTALRFRSECRVA